MCRRNCRTFVLALCLTDFATQAAPPPTVPPPIAVYFSPRGGCTDAIAAELDHATDNILVQAYSFTSAPIAKALVAAHKRGVKVEIVLDKSQRTEKYSSATFVFNTGIPTFIDASHAIAHNKIIIVDRATVITGSFNFSKAAEESNAENLLVIHDRVLAEKYAANWAVHRDHATPYVFKGKER